ncbi:hypothetical protein [Alkalihalobacillus trypoxylicola]|uniref:Phage portal protein n=1 Tax=Alkalihalobacillus trypoxylicola TaxID=519424 RepID=A0A162EWE1_9BACI|nr:hypothetical protein [Alkalihalobacillus trypoxylicola]KYG33896.1 hypothetical protein AZF04_15400 [Alkalihalobacillus trypoxylicola]
MNSEVKLIGEFLTKNLDVPIYIDELEPNHEIPSIYIPQPSVTNGIDTVSTYNLSYTLNIKVFHTSSVHALEETEKLADAIRNNRMLITIVDGTVQSIGNSFIIRNVEVRGSNQNFASLILNWSSRYQYTKPEFPPLKGVGINNGVKR